MEDINEQIYADIKSLLEDICVFLQNKCGNFSSADKAIAGSIIEKCTKQLSKLTENRPDYVVMSSGTSVDYPSNPPLLPKTAKIPKKINTELHKEGTVSTNEELNDYTNTNNVPHLLEERCSFSDLPAKDASQEIKCGTLIFQRRIFSFLPRSTEVFGSIHNSWLLIYWSSKDSKPFCTLNLKKYEAHQDEYENNSHEAELEERNLKTNKSKRNYFKVVDSSLPEKHYQFVAKSHKDMLQWVYTINSVNGKKTIKDREDCNSNNEDDTENIYAEVIIQSESKTPVLLPKSKASEDTDRPPLPDKPANLKPKTDLKHSNISCSSSDTSETNGLTEENLSSSKRLSDTSDNKDYIELDVVKSTIFIEKEALSHVKVEDECDRENIEFRKSSTEVKLDVEHDDSQYEEFFVASVTPPKKSLKGNVMKIVRSISNKTVPSNNFETFSRNSKIETFQASPSKETVIDISSLTTKPTALIIDSVGNNHKNKVKKEAELPMVLRSALLGDEINSTKKKSPTVHIKPCSKKHF
ncbi:uncharacterized protein LOC115875022 isoform X2 [Sitophilus oryzae]|uniref:Uncharacterized protein LOC115875022 isoform X2 n=1 Tax=Sitophilus oryzae TaxID=7048 RepID=A0A6J2X4W1_SITOR|nr:uncharacterized protein LOC115875022 isoform X2 [Sitophilus oryzae]